MTPAEVLSKAADLIEQRGWFQTYYDDEDSRDPKGCVCVYGAINLAQTGSPREDGPLSRDVLGVLEQFVGEWPPCWNDEPGRTQDEVVATLRTAAERAS